MAVYFIQIGDGGSIKIGHSASPPARLSQLQSSHSEPLKLLAVIDGDSEEEHSIHEMFAEFWQRGEWFAPAPSLVAYIRTLPAYEVPDRRPPGRKADPTRRRVHLFVLNDLIEWVEARAQEENRPLSRQIEVMIAEARNAQAA